MELERRTLYNLLRMNWQNDPNLAVQPWQVEDYRVMPLEALFKRLKENDIFLDRVSFLALAESLETPEDLADELLADRNLDPLGQDQVYLVIFELWRRFVPEKLCLSIFCDELDHQIDLYDRGEIDDAEPIQDVLANLEVILEENVDNGGNPQEVFEEINLKCANDLESFLYDFIADQIYNKDYIYASELLEDFTPYVKDLIWFDFLKACVVAVSDVPQANRLIRQIIKETEDDVNADAELNLEILSFLAQEGDKDLFVTLVKKTLPKLESEEEFQDLLAIVAEYFHRLDQDAKEQAIQQILKERARISPETPHDPGAPNVAQLLKVLMS